ncbi:hypothetical protein LCGC14_0294840 [marine sediment metagenome]|uniref:Uncharacterized protein n=1 Tax=marine sediment metagenome TaxID=412755 RepID=A0A0F9WDD3_9ZZZZ
MERGERGLDSPDRSKNLQRYKTRHEAREAALAKAHKLGLDVAIRRTKEYGKEGYNVSLACTNDSDYIKAEIVRPTDMI